MAEKTLYNGARLWQLPEIFPRALLMDTDGFIRPSTVDSRVYLTDSYEVALAYGAIPGADWVKRHREQGESMAFLPFGVILSVNRDRVDTRRLQPEESTAKIHDETLHNQLHVAEGPLEPSSLEGVDFVFYERIVASDAPLVDANLCLIPDDQRTVRAMNKTKRLLGGISVTIFRSNPDMVVNNVDSGLTPERAITIFERT